MDSFWNALWEGSECLIRGIKAVLWGVLGTVVAVIVLALAATVVMGFVRVFQWAWGG